MFTIKKIKNDKIKGWHIELANFSYDILYHFGRYNVVADALSRAYCNATFTPSLDKLHDDL